MNNSSVMTMQALSSRYGSPATYEPGKSHLEWHRVFALLAAPAPALQLTQRPFEVSHHLQMHALTRSASTQLLTHQLPTLTNSPSPRSWREALSVAWAPAAGQHSNLPLLWAFGAAIICRSLQAPMFPLPKLLRARRGATQTLPEDLKTHLYSQRNMAISSRRETAACSQAVVQRLRLTPAQGIWGCHHLQVPGGVTVHSSMAWKLACLRSTMIRI